MGTAEDITEAGATWRVEVYKCFAAGGSVRHWYARVDVGGGLFQPQLGAGQKFETRAAAITWARGERDRMLSLTVVQFAAEADRAREQLRQSSAANLPQRARVA